MINPSKVEILTEMINPKNNEIKIIILKKNNIITNSLYT